MAAFFFNVLGIGGAPSGGRTGCADEKIWEPWDKMIDQIVITHLLLKYKNLASLKKKKYIVIFYNTSILHLVATLLSFFCFYIKITQIYTMS